MINELDKKVLELFRFLISSGTKYLNRIDYMSGALVYTVNDKAISLNLFKRLAEKEAFSNSYSTVDNLTGGFRDPIFWGTLASDSGKYEVVYEILLEGKYYRVPELSRLEQAQTLDRIDAILEERESEILDSVLNEFTADSREEL